MNSYLDKFLSTIPVSQREALRSISASKSVSGEVTSIEQLLQGLNSLAITSLDSVNPRPLSSNLSLGSKVGSAQLNTLFTFISHDLNTIFNELESLSSFFEQLDRLSSIDVSLTEKQLRELDSTLSLVEVLEENSTDGYLAAQFNTFDSNKSSALSINDPFAANVYIDPRTNRQLQDLLLLDIAREGLTLPVEVARPQKVRNVFVSAGANTTESDIRFKVIGDDLRIGDEAKNLLSKDNSFWAHFCYLGKTQFRSSAPDSTRAEIIIDLGGATTVNHLFISPIASTPLALESISYEGADSSIYLISDVDILLNSDTTITFSTVVASKLLIQLRQDNYERISTEFRTADGPYISIPEQLQEIAGGTGVLAFKEVSGSSKIDSNRLDGWLYIFALDAVRVGKATFKDKGIFVSQELAIKEPLYKVAVKTTSANTTSKLDNVADVFEYWIYKADMADGVAINTTLLPILPLGQQSIVHESLAITSSSISELRFFPDITQAITVYRDFTPLTVDLDFKISVDGGVHYEGSTSYSQSPVGPPYKYRISILSPQSDSVYTVSYIPKELELSPGFPIYLDQLSTATLGQDNSITFIYPTSLKNRIESSRVYLICLIRSLNHDSYFRETPILFDYTLLVG
jgi:hypothetical protein